MGGCRALNKKDLAVYVWLQYLLGSWWSTAYGMQHQYKHMRLLHLEVDLF